MTSPEIRTEPDTRFHSLDSLRAVAMLLGVVYHALLFGGGLMAQFGGGAKGFDIHLMDWIHSFRMALFFMISGFFSHMMLLKYGLWTYLAKRWWRLFAAMVIYLFALVGINRLTGNSGGFGPGGPGPGPAPEGGPQARGSAVPGPIPVNPDAATPRGPRGLPPGVPEGIRGPSGPPGPGGPPPEFGPGMFIASALFGAADADTNGVVSREEFTVAADKWFDVIDSRKKGSVNQQAVVEGLGQLLSPQADSGPSDGRPEPQRGRRAVVGPAMFIGPGFFHALDADKDARLSRAEMSAGFAGWFEKWDLGKSDKLDEAAIRTGLNSVLGGPQGPGRRGGPGGEGGFGPFGGGSPIADRLFGPLARQFNMGPMWFLWFLIVFVTAGPLVASLVAKVVGSPGARVADLLVRRGLAPLVLALVCIPALWFAGTRPGSPPDGMTGIAGTFPDVMFRYHPDWPYFFTFFMTGWALYAVRSRVPDIGRFWLPTLLVGLAAHGLAEGLKPEGGPFMPADDLAWSRRLATYAAFTLASAFTSFGLMGLFQRYLDRPATWARYLADTAFWIYLMHQELLVRVILPWLRGYLLPWYVQMPAAVAATTVLSMIAFELFVRRTPLAVLFGSGARKKSPKPAVSSAPAQ